MNGTIRLENEKVAVEIKGRRVTVLGESNAKCSRCKLVLRAVKLRYAEGARAICCPCGAQYGAHTGGCGCCLCGAESLERSEVVQRSRALGLL